MMCLSRYTISTWSVLLLLSGCITPGTVVKVSPPDAYRNGYPTGNIIRPAAPAPDDYNANSIDRLLTDDVISEESTPSRVIPPSGMKKAGIASCVGQQLSCIYDHRAIALGSARTSSGNILRRAFKAPLKVPGQYRKDARAGAVTFGGIGQETPSRIFTVYYNDASGVISDIVF